jgi:hypothetical protein
MPIPNLLAMALGLIVTAIGVLGLAAPSILVELARSLQSPGALYFVAIVRVAFGTVLLWAASDSRTPRILRILGVFIIIAGIATPVFGVERSRTLLDWWSTQGSFLARSWPILAIGFGLFIAYTTMPRYAG